MSPAQQGPSGAAVVDDDLTTFAREYDEDSRRLRWALAAAAALHIGLFAIQLPERVQPEPRPAERRPVFVVQQVRFKPPQQQQQQQDLSRPPSKRVPIPEPTPDAPEPIRIVEQVRQQLDVPLDEAEIGIPVGPPPVADTPQGPIQVGGDVRAPEKLFARQPNYTEIARKARVQGIVIVQAIIDKQGNVTNIKVLRGLPMGLEEAAVEAMKKWKFKPATLNGKPVTVYYNLTVNFKLQ